MHSHVLTIWYLKYYEYPFAYVCYAQFVVHEVPGIQQCFIAESKEAGEVGMWRLKTEGVNMQVHWVLQRGRLLLHVLSHSTGTFGS